MSVSGLAEPIVSMAEAEAFARIETGEEEALLAGLVRTASGICEAFIGQVVIARPFSEAVAPSSQWQRLRACPVRSISEVADAAGNPLLIGSYETEVDSRGDGWVRLSASGPQGPLQVSGIAGLASSENEVPEPIRHGVLRLVSHLFSSRDDDGGTIPAAVTALWRPYRRLAL